MRRIMTIMATALLASTLLASAAQARGGGFGGGGHMGGFGGGGHIGGFGGGVHMGGGFEGGMGHIGGGETHFADHGMGFRDHAMHRFVPGYYDGTQSCYYPDEAPKVPPWPPYCG